MCQQCKIALELLKSAQREFVFGSHSEFVHLISRVYEELEKGVAEGR